MQLIGVVFVWLLGRFVTSFTYTQLSYTILLHVMNIPRKVPLYQM